MDINKARDLYEAGSTLVEIGKVFGVCGRTVGKYLKAAGCKIRDHSQRAIGPLNFSWKGGRSITKDGYVHIRVDGVYILEHRLVMERLIGRPLTSCDVVHHCNGIRDDNRPENLKLCTASAHRAEHILTCQWSRKYEACVVCGTTERKHAGKGYCTRCNQHKRTVASRGYECEYKDGRRVFTSEHRASLSSAMCGNTNGIQNLKQFKKCCGR